MGRSVRSAAQKANGRKRRRPSNPTQRKGLEALSNVPLPVEEDSELEGGELSEQDVEFVEKHSAKLSFLEKIERDELDRQVIDRQKMEAEKRAEKIERAQKRAARPRAKPEEVSSSEEDELDREFARRQTETDGLKPKGVAQVSVRPLLLPMKTPDGRIVLEHENDGAAADLARRVDGVTVDDVFAEGKDEAEENESTSEKDERDDSHVPKEARKTENMEEEEEPEDVVRETEESRGPMLGREELKTQIAVHANKLLTQAEKSVAPLQKLLVLCKNRDAQIQQLALISCVRVFKDIIPGYKIANNVISSEEQAKKKMKKEQLKTKEYEALLLKCYQAFLKTLISASHSAKKNGETRMLRVCVKSLCGLAESLQHFNYGTDLIKTVVTWMNFPDPVVLKTCTDSAAEIIKTDSVGHRTLEVIQFVGDLVKRHKCGCDPQVVECLLNIKFRDLPTLSKEDTKEKKVSKHRRKKMFKLRDQLEKQGQDYEVHRPKRDRDSEDKTALQTQTVEALFEIFFRVLKHCSHLAHSRSCYEHEESVHRTMTEKCPLLTVSLKGLGKYAHVMSIEYFEDLLQVMTKLLSCVALPFYERFQCLFTISSIFRRQGEALNIDRKDFYQQLYAALNQWNADAVQTGHTARCSQGVLLVHVCHQMLCETKSSDFGRLAAFVKRLLSVAIHQETGVAMGMAAVVNKLLVKYRRLRPLLEGESELPVKGTSHDPFVDDPSQAAGLLTSLWEVTLLRSHFHPHVVEAAGHLLKMKPDATDSEGSYVAGVLTSTEGPPGVTVRYNSQKGAFCPAPRLQTQGKRRRRTRDMTPDFAALVPDEVADPFAAMEHRFRQVYESVATVV